MVETETVIAADGAAPGLLQRFEERLRCAGVAAHWRRRAICRRGLVVFRPALGFGSLKRYGFFLGQTAWIPSHPLNRRHGCKVVGALQIRMSVRPTRRPTPSPAVPHCVLHLIP